MHHFKRVGTKVNDTMQLLEPGKHVHCGKYQCFGAFAHSLLLTRPSDQSPAGALNRLKVAHSRPIWEITRRPAQDYQVNIVVKDGCAIQIDNWQCLATITPCCTRRPARSLWWIDNWPRIFGGDRSHNSPASWKYHVWSITTKAFVLLPQSTMARWLHLFKIFDSNPDVPASCISQYFERKQTL